MAYIFKIKIAGLTKPPVWRRLQVPQNITFDRFHMMIQVAFGWENDHLYKFSDVPYGSPFEISMPSEFEDFGMGGLHEWHDSGKMKLSDYFSEEKRHLVYLYDFGDDWVHEIVLEEINDEEPSSAVCLQGKGACPPEDVGGPMGYENLKRAFREDPGGEEATMYAEWLWLAPDETFDPTAFNLKMTNLELQGV